MLRSIGVILLSLCAAVVVIFIFEYLSHIINKAPADLNQQDPEAMKTWIKSLPWQALFLVVLAWFCGSAAGGFVIAKMDPQNKLRSSITLAVMLLASVAINLASLEHPGWMWPAGLLSIVAGIWCGGKLTTWYRSVS